MGENNKSKNKIIIICIVVVISLAIIGLGLSIYWNSKNKSKDQNNTIVPAELIIAKHRKGSLGTIDLQFELNYGLFKSVLKEQGE